MACIFLVISFIHSFFYTVNIFQKDLFQTLEHPMLKYVNLKIRMQKLLMGPWDPGSKWRYPNAGTQVPGPELSGLECLGPKCWYPPSRDPNEGTEMLGPKYLDPNSWVWNVRVSDTGCKYGDKCPCVVEVDCRSRYIGA